MSTEDKITGDELTDLIGRVRVSFGGFEDADALIAEAEQFAARLAEVEAERDMARRQIEMIRTEWHQAAEDVAKLIDAFNDDTRDILLKAARVALNGPGDAPSVSVEPVPSTPRVFAMPPEPGPEVTRVRDVYGQGFSRATAYGDDEPEDGWLGDAFTTEADVPDLFLTWKQLMANHAPLVEVEETNDAD